MALRPLYAVGIAGHVPTAFDEAHHIDGQVAGRGVSASMRRPMARKKTLSPLGDNSSFIFKALFKATGINNGASSRTTLKRRTPFKPAEPDGALIRPTRVDDPPIPRGAAPMSSSSRRSCGKPSASHFSIIAF